MKKHAASHAGAVLICTIAGALITDVIRKHTPIVYKFVNGFSRTVVDAFSIGFAPEMVTTLLYATLLAMIWGIAFALINKR
jgi:hypothetical protein